MTINQNGNWQLYWGAMPLPKGATPKGTVHRPPWRGALLMLKNGIFVQGNAGGIRTLPQREVQRLLKEAR